MLLDILTPEKLLFEGEIKSVKLPGTNGEFEILNNHAPIISTLSKGEICVTNLKNDKEYAYLAYQNFDNILKWNRSNFFAVAVGSLSDHILYGK